MKIGFVVHFFDFRNDVRSLINKVSESKEVILFVNHQHYELVKNYNLPKVEIRLIEEVHKSFKNKIVNLLYRFFKKIPRSKNNFYLMQCFHISRISNSRRRFINRVILKLIMFLPKFIAYDWLLRNLTYTSKTKINDVEKMYFFTEISNDYFLARCIFNKIRNYVYVYSWDHPFKHTKFSNLVNYLTWSESTKEDLIFNMNISRNNIKVFGSTQLCYVHEALKTKIKQKSYNFKYIYFACAIGIDSLVEKEISVIRHLNSIMLNNNSDLKLVVRPYPVLDDWSPMENLRNEGIIIDDDFRTQDLSVSRSSINEKFEKIQNSELFVHLGSTIGLEASFFDTLSVIVDFAHDKSTTKKLSLKNFIHQGQNVKYLIKNKSSNYFDSEDKFINWLNIYKNGSIVKPNNKDISKDFHLNSFSHLSNKLVLY